VAGSCGTCHTGTYLKAVGKTATNFHTVSTAACDTCHKSTAVWTTTSFSHTGVVAGSCVSCHVGARAKVKGTAAKPGHVVTSAACDSCHKQTTAWLPVTSFNHVGVVAGSCGTCHNGTSATGKNLTTHIPTSAACDSCHKITTAWIPATYGHVGVVAGSCGTCHTGTYQKATGKTATNFHTATTSTPCDTCHRSTAVWTTTSFGHVGVTPGSCVTCHVGARAKVKGTAAKPGHIVTTAACDSCHRTTAWVPATSFNHVGVTPGSCGTCHNGTSATGKTATNYHAVTTAACDTCHRSTATWTTTSFGHVGVAPGSCITCHVGARAKVKGTAAKPGHVVTTLACDSCHRTTAWIPASFNHVGVAVGTCGTCHNGSNATGKNLATHIPTTGMDCDSCHKVSGWKPATMNHTAVATATCKSCHDGRYLSQGTTGALAKPINHIPEAQLLNGAAMDCKACHATTTSWISSRTNHNGSLGGGAGWCKGCHLSGQTYLGGMERKSLTHEKKTPPAIDCSESGCHRPLGNKGSTYSNWD
jgi:hypothetical protein